MKNLIRFIGLLLCSGLVLSSCSDNEMPEYNDFVVAFKSPSASFSTQDSILNIELVFSRKAPHNGQVTLTFSSDQFLYGSDFVCTPPAEEGTLTIPIERGQSSTTFSLKKQAPVSLGTSEIIKFSIVDVEMKNMEAFTQGNTLMSISLIPTAALGGTIQPEVGGPNEPYQVYIDLSRQHQHPISRDTWDLGFYTGDKFRVKLNSSMYMFAAPLSATDIDLVTSADVSELKPKMDFLVQGSDAYVDHPSGKLEGTAIEAVSTDNSTNPVYLLKLGYEIGSAIPNPGSVAIAGEERGFMKIRILQSNGNYVLQYAHLNDPTHQEIIIPKTGGYNFTFFSFKTESIVQVEPAQTAWDLSFTVKTEIEDLPGGGKTAYGYADYISINNLGGTRAYRVSTDDFSYETFALTDVDDSKFVADQQIIGSSWRKTTPPDRQVFTDIFYVIKDPEGNYYKLKMTALQNENGLRGHPEFKYELLQ